MTTFRTFFRTSNPSIAAEGYAKPARGMDMTGGTVPRHRSSPRAAAMLCGECSESAPVAVSKHSCGAPFIIECRFHLSVFFIVA